MYKYKYIYIYVFLNVFKDIYIYISISIYLSLSLSYIYIHICVCVHFLSPSGPPLCNHVPSPHTDKQSFTVVSAVPGHVMPKSSGVGLKEEVLHIAFWQRLPEMHRNCLVELLHVTSELQQGFQVVDIIP